MGGKKGATGKRGQELIKLGVRVGQHTEPFLNTIQDLGLGQIAQYMATGKVENAEVGLAREGAMSAVGEGQKAIAESLAASGLAGTPYAAAAKGEAAMRGGLAIRDAEHQAKLEYLNMIPGFLQQPSASVAPFLGVPNAALAQGGNAGAGLAAAGAYGAAGNAVGQLLTGYLNRPDAPSTGAGAGAGNSPSVPVTEGGGGGGQWGW